MILEDVPVSPSGDDESSDESATSSAFGEAFAVFAKYAALGNAAVCATLAVAATAVPEREVKDEVVQNVEDGVKEKDEERGGENSGDAAGDVARLPSSSSWAGSQKSFRRMRSKARVSLRVPLRVPTHSPRLSPGRKQSAGTKLRTATQLLSAQTGKTAKQQDKISALKEALAQKHQEMEAAQLEAEAEAEKLKAHIQMLERSLLTERAGQGRHSPRGEPATSEESNALQKQKEMSKRQAALLIEISKLTNMLQKSDAALKEKSALLEQQAAQSAGAEDATSELREQVAELEEALDLRSEELETRVSQCAALEGELRVLREREAVLEAKGKKQRDLQARVDQLLQETASLHGEKEALQKQAKEQTAKAMAAASRLTMRTADLLRAEDAAALERKRAEDLESTNTALRQQIETLQAQLRDLPPPTVNEVVLEERAGDDGREVGDDFLPVSEVVPWVQKLAENAGHHLTPVVRNHTRADVLLELQQVCGAVHTLKESLRHEEGWNSDGDGDDDATDEDRQGEEAGDNDNDDVNVNEAPRPKLKPRRRKPKSTAVPAGINNFLERMTAWQEKLAALWNERREIIRTKNREALERLLMQHWDSSPVLGLLQGDALRQGNGHDRHVLPLVGGGCSTAPTTTPPIGVVSGLREQCPMCGAALLLLPQLDDSGGRGLRKPRKKPKPPKKQEANGEEGEGDYSTDEEGPLPERAHPTVCLPHARTVTLPLRVSLPEVAVTRLSKPTCQQLPPPSRRPLADEHRAHQLRVLLEQQQQEGVAPSLSIHPLSLPSADPRSGEHRDRSHPLLKSFVHRHDDDPLSPSSFPSPLTSTGKLHSRPARHIKPV